MFRIRTPLYLTSGIQIPIVTLFCRIVRKLIMDRFLVEELVRIYLQNVLTKIAFTFIHNMSLMDAKKVETGCQKQPKPANFIKWV